MRTLAVGFGCVWVLWSAPVAERQPGPAATQWSVVGKVGGREECVAYQAHKSRAESATRVQYVCLPEGEQPR